jgi:NitT/TauT family transport system permease protein
LIDNSLLEAAQTLGADRRRLLTHVILPGILPNLYNDMRILVGWAWTYLIIAELIGASSGISWFINQQGKHFHFDNVFAGIIMIGIIGLATDQLLALFRPILFPWTAERSHKKRGPSRLGLLLIPFRGNIAHATIVPAEPVADTDSSQLRLSVDHNGAQPDAPAA